METPDESSLTLLVVDDDTEVRTFLGFLFKRYGYRVLQAEDGASALLTLADHPEIGIVLLDWMMPGMDGMQVLREIGNLEDPPPVLMLTAKTQRDDIMEALKAGAVDYIVKPVEKDQLLFKVNNILQRNPDEARARAARRKPVSFGASTTFVIVDVTEKELVLESSFPVAAEAVLFFQSFDLASRLDLARDHRFSLKIRQCVGQGNRHRLNAEFIGLPPPVVQNIKRLNESGGWGR